MREFLAGVFAVHDLAAFYHRQRLVDALSRRVECADVGVGDRGVVARPASLMVMVTERLLTACDERRLLLKRLGTLP